MKIAVAAKMPKRPLATKNRASGAKSSASLTRGWTGFDGTILRLSPATPLWKRLFPSGRRPSGRRLPIRQRTNRSLGRASGAWLRSLVAGRIPFRFLDDRSRTLQSVLRAPRDFRHLSPYFSCPCLRRQSPLWKPRLVLHFPSPFVAAEQTTLPPNHYEKDLGSDFGLRKPNKMGPGRRRAYEASGG